MSEERRKFAVGDRVRPTEDWRSDPQVPQGKVVQVASFGRGQAVCVEGHKRWILSGCFELEPSK